MQQRMNPPFSDGPEGHVFFDRRPTTRPSGPSLNIVIIVLALASTLRAQPAPIPAAPAHVGIVKLRIVYQNMKQTLEFDHVVQEMQNHLASVTADHQKQLSVMQKQISDAAEKKSNASDLIDLMDEKALQFQVEEQALKQELTRAIARNLTKAYGQIETAVDDVVARERLDTMLVNDAANIPPNAADIPKLDNLANLLFNRDVLYVSDKLDFTAEVIGQLNSNFVPTSQPTPPPALATTKMQIGSKTFTLEIAADEDSQHRGLMERDTIEKDHGMIFVFAVAGEQTFWGHHTRFPLDVIFIDSKGVIISIKLDKAYDETNIPSDGDAKYAIELPAGQAAAAGVKPGDQLKIPPGVDATVKK